MGHHVKYAARLRRNGKGADSPGVREFRIAVEMGRPDYGSTKRAAFRDAVWAAAPGGIAAARMASLLGRRSLLLPFVALIPQPQPVPKYTLSVERNLVASTRRL
jgi:hypothetical protein